MLSFDAIVIFVNRTAMNKINSTKYVVIATVRVILYQICDHFIRIMSGDTTTERSEYKFPPSI